jgi:hypothetical protein
VQVPTCDLEDPQSYVAELRRHHARRLGRVNESQRCEVYPSFTAELAKTKLQDGRAFALPGKPN